MILNTGINYTPSLKQNFKASLLAQMMKNSNVQQNTAPEAAPVSQNQGLPLSNPAHIPVTTPVADKYVQTMAKNSLLTALMAKTAASQNIQQQPVAQTAAVTPVKTPRLEGYQNNLRSMFQNNQAVIYAMVPRTFNAKDTDGNGLIEGNEEPGYFTNMVERLDELKSYGINTLHWLPINPPGKIAAKGNAGSVYAPLDYLSIDPNLDDPKDPRDVYEEAKYAINECHKRGIKVMVDLPSCMSVDLYNARPDLRATDAEGKPKTPEGWEDIRMFDPWKDPDKGELNQALVDYHKKFIDMCIELGIDGIRADVGRAKPPQFWDIITSYARSKDPEFGFLAECYTYEDASPMKNMPADRPEEALDSGFDTYYGQYHIFHMWKASDFNKFMQESLNISHNHPKGKALIGSFATHDDKSPMANGGPDYCMMTNVLQATLPMTNPYIISGFESGDRYIYPYGKKFVNNTFNQLLENPVYKDTVNSLLNNSGYEDREKLRKLVSGNDANKKVEELAEDPEYKSIIDFLDHFSLTKDNIRHYVHSEFLDIFNKSRRPGGENPEIGHQFGYLMNTVRPKYGEVITKGSYIPLKVDNDSRDEVIAYARCKDGKTLVTIANHDVNARQKVKVRVPGMSSAQVLEDLSPRYGTGSTWEAKDNAIEIDLGPAQAHIFEIDDPELPNLVKPEMVWQQNL